MQPRLLKLMKVAQMVRSSLSTEPTQYYPALPPQRTYPTGGKESQGKRKYFTTMLVLLVKFSCLA
jgi:hypothetical protein